MIDERTEELAALYVFDLLEGAELAAFESSLAQNPELRELVAELREGASAIALTAPAAVPPPELKVRLMARLPETSRAGDTKVVRFALPAWIPWAIAACLACAAAWLAQLFVAEKARYDQLREQTELAGVELRSLKNELEAERIVTGRQIAQLQEQIKNTGDLSRLEIAKLVSLLGNSSHARAVAVWDQDSQQGVLTVEGLPAPAADQDYQLWVIDPHYPDPVSSGVFAVNSGTGEARFAFHPGRPIATAAKFAVSRERKGGRPKPEGPIVLLSE